MLSYRTIAGFGAAALAFIALSKISRHYRNRGGESAGYSRKVAGRMEGIIRRRRNINIDLTNDVI
ncbi:hypothetical protein [Pelotomaculum propionicicum]|uniref:Uncharacterized protein n=1 Tax=Pelotomaculum propionicicum TaxID=258475 RepID=A0A4Y7RPE1_9FIRM|nr:hypothetical protein [Pelotomaculum propionicicum]TEB10723.1 hypothetical protein Pmgp_02175 [Pelotomaculum propionicicum]